MDGGAGSSRFVRRHASRNSPYVVLRLSHAATMECSQPQFYHTKNGGVGSSRVLGRDHIQRVVTRSAPGGQEPRKKVSIAAKNALGASR